MKVYLNYSGEQGAPEMKLKTTLPASWADSPVERVVGFFCKQYNVKNPDTPLGQPPAALLPCLQLICLVVFFFSFSSVVLQSVMSVLWWLCRETSPTSLYVDSISFASNFDSLNESQQVPGKKRVAGW